jgi:hypothetical protein
MTFSAMYTRPIENLLRNVHYTHGKARYFFFFIPLSSGREILRRRFPGKLSPRYHSTWPGAHAKSVCCGQRTYKPVDT